MEKRYEPAHVQLAIMSRGYVLSRAIHAIAQLGVANYMSAHPISVSQLACQTHTDVSLLHRIMQFLAAYGIFSYQAPDSYALTELSMPLRDDDPHSIKDVLCMVDDTWWQAFSSLDQSLKKGTPAFNLQHGDNFFNFLSKNPQKQANFDRGMAKLSTYDDDSIANAYDFSQFKHLVDLGGGRGGLAKAIHKCFPKLTMTLFDTKSVISQLKQEEFPPQIYLQSGDFLATIPLADAYIFKGVLHDFNDEFMHSILINCYQQIPENAKLLIAEQVMPDDCQPHPNKTMDIVMMVLLGGRQRTLTEWQKSIEPSGFKFQAHYPTSSIFTVMEFSKINK